MTESNAGEFKYDVAISFLSQDEGVATEILHRLTKTLRVFIYTREQEQIAGRDGEQILNAVFEQEARVVLVLFRAQWGSTPFTRVEETSLRNRAYDEGYDFTVFVPLGNDPLPRWLPKTRIWTNLDRLGLDGLTAIVEARVVELGGTVRTLSPVDRTAALHRELTFQQERKHFLSSSQGVAAAQASFKEIVNILNGIVNLAESATPIGLTIGSNGGVWTLRCKGVSVSLYLDQPFSNTVDETALEVRFWDGVVPFHEHFVTQRPQPTASEAFSFDLRLPDQHGWVNNERQFFTKTQLAEHIYDGLLLAVESKHIGKRSS